MSTPPPESPLESPSPDRPGKVVPRWRLILYLLVLVLGVWGAARLGGDPQADLETLLEQTREEPSRSVFRSGRVFLSFLPRDKGYVLSLNVEGIERFAPARYLVVVQDDGRRTIELLVNPNQEGVERYEGERLREYLARCRLDLDEVDTAYQRRRGG